MGIATVGNRYMEIFLNRLDGSSFHYSILILPRTDWITLRYQVIFVVSIWLLKQMLMKHMSELAWLSKGKRLSCSE